MVIPCKFESRYFVHCVSHDVKFLKMLSTYDGKYCKYGSSKIKTEMERSKKHCCTVFISSGDSFFQEYLVFARIGKTLVGMPPLSLFYPQYLASFV